MEGWRRDSPLRGRVTAELLRRGRPLLPGVNGSVVLGPPGRAVIHAFPEWGRFGEPGGDLVVDGWTIPGHPDQDLALLDRAEGVVYIPMRLNFTVQVPQPDAYAR